MDAPPHTFQHGDAAAKPRDAKPSITPIACIPCRRVKMKCMPGADLSTCLRCQRKQVDCYYENHRRGRKVGTKLRPHAKSDRPPLSVEMPTLAGNQNASRGYQQVRIAQLVEPSIAVEDKQVDGLSPFRLLNKHAMGGSFSVQNVLAAESAGDATGESSNVEGEISTASSERDRTEDPVELGLISLPMAMQLFDSFLKYMAPFIIHFDAILHTYEYVQHRSSFLLTTILSASAKIFQPELHPKLRAHSEDLLAKAFMSGEKSIDTIKAILMLTYWKQPDDTRVFQRVGYACRMCVELRGRRTHTRNAEIVQREESPTKIRERRNIERTWLTLFVYDRSICLQTGKQWMLHIDELTRRVDTWYGHELGIPHGDAILAAFVQLRILSSDLLDVLEIDLTQSNQQQQEILLNLFNAELDKWEKRWNVVFEKTSPGPCHQFLFRFYAFHTRLYINSLRLQIMLFYPTTGAKQALWLSYSSALGMLETVIDVLGPSQLLYYCQDSIHVMTAYAAVFLVKILLSMPEALPQTAESTIIELLARASQGFGGQCATDYTGCAYQSRFLQNVVTQYWSSKKSKHFTETVHNTNPGLSRPRSLDASLRSTSSAEDPSGISNSQNAQLEPSNISGLFSRPPAEEMESHETTSASNDCGLFMNSSTFFPFGAQKYPDLGGTPFWHQDVMDPDVWEELLADACFHTEDATVMPSLF